jgi:hypothetical protein
MLRHIRTHEELFCNVKLVNGEEIIGKCIVVDDEEDNYTLMIENPCEAHIVEKETSSGEIISGLALSKWMSFTKEDFCIIDDDKIISVSPLNDEMKTLYNMFIVKEMKKKDTTKKKTKKDVSKEVGLIDNIEKMRKKLEDIFKNN